MKSPVTSAETDSAREIIESMTWNRPRSTEELLTFISGRHAKLEDVELGI